MAETPEEAPRITDKRGQRKGKSDAPPEMTEEQRALLAQQAAEMESSPYTGLGADDEEDAPEDLIEVRTIFTVIVQADGTHNVVAAYDPAQYTQTVPMTTDSVMQACRTVAHDCEVEDTVAKMLLAMEVRASRLGGIPQPRRR